MSSNIFLRNANLLEEIEKSKLSYCCYEKPEYAKHDIVFQSFELISPSVIDEFFISNLDKDRIIMRVMTDEHIINAPVKYKMVETCGSSMPPFKHFLLTRNDFYKVKELISVDIENISVLERKIEENKQLLKDVKASLRSISTAEKMNKPTKENKDDLKLVEESLTNQNKMYLDQIVIENDLFNISLRPFLQEVLRSHWDGKTIESGHLSYIKGNLTNKLAMMLQLLASRYIKAGNWSGYSYIDDMECAGVAKLCEVVLKFDAGVSNNPFSYLTSCISNVYVATLNKEKEQRMIKSAKMQEIGYSATFNEIEKEMERYSFEEVNLQSE